MEHVFPTLNFNPRFLDLSVVKLLGCVLNWVGRRTKAYMYIYSQYLGKFFSLNTTETKLQSA